MKRRVISFLLATVMIVGIFVGCGKKEDVSQGTSSSVASVASTAPVGELIGGNVKFDTGKKIEGTLNVWFYEDGKRFIQPLFDDYQKYRPGVKLNVTYVPWGDYWKKIPVAVSGGNGPDLFYFHNSFQNLMVDGGLMAPYPKELVDNLKKDYKNVEQFDIDGKTFYIGVGGGHGLIYYNKDIWSQAGLTDADIPQTWEQLREIAIKLTQKNADKIKVSGFNFNPGAGAFINDWQFLSGRFLFSEDGKKIMIDNDDFKKTLKFFTDLYTVDKVCTPTFPDSQQSFKDGTTAMIWMHPFFNGILKAETPNLKYGVFPLPKFEGAQRNWHFNNPDVSMGINSKVDDKQKELAADLLTLFFADDKYMREWDLAQGLAPTKISLEVDETLAKDPVIQILMKDFDNSVYVGPAPDAMTQDLIQNLIDPILKGNISIDEAMKNSVAKVNKTLADFNWKPTERVWSYANELK